jgi:hypothetical protein
LYMFGRLSSPFRRPSVIDQLQILSKFKIRKINTSIRTMWYPVQMRISIRQESQFKYLHPDISQPWSRRACN